MFPNIRDAFERITRSRDPKPRAWTKEHLAHRWEKAPQKIAPWRCHPVFLIKLEQRQPSLFRCTLLGHAF
jgi:hypothetical protein